MGSLDAFFGCPISGCFDEPAELVFNTLNRSIDETVNVTVIVQLQFNCMRSSQYDNPCSFLIAVFLS